MIYTKDSTYSVGTISDCTDHRGPAVWTGLEKVLPIIISEKAKSVIIISDSTSQYRNKFPAFFTQKCANLKIENTCK